MANYPERYYELLTMRDQLNDDIEFMKKIGLNDISKLIDVQLYLTQVEAEIKQIEKDYMPKEFYMVNKEVYDKLNDDYYYVLVGEYFEEEEALEAFKEEQEWLITEFDADCTITEEPGLFTIEDKDASATLVMVKVEVEPEQ